MKELNPCRCGNRPELVTTSTGLVRIACVLGKCSELVCARADVAERAWNEANPCDDAPTLKYNEVPVPLTVVSAEDARNFWVPPGSTHEQEAEASKSGASFVYGDEIPTAIDVALPEDWSEV